MRTPKNCIEIIENIKRFIKIMENNERNSTNSQNNQRSRLSRADRVGKIEFRARQKDEEDLYRELKKIDASLDYDEDRIHSQWKENKNRFVDINLEYPSIYLSNLILKNPPREVKYIVSLKLIEFGLDLLQQR